MPGRNKLPIALTGALLLCSLLFYLPLFLTEGVYVFRDNYYMILPMEHMTRMLQELKPFPLWNPFVGTGKPLAAEPLSGLFYPPNLVFRLLREPLGLTVSLCFHHAVAAISFGVLLRMYGISALASFLGAVLFSFGGYYRSLDIMLNGLQSATWIPVTLLCSSLFLNTRAPVLLIASGLSCSLLILGGWPESIVFLSLFLLTLGFYRRYKGGREGYNFAVLYVSLHIIAICTSACLLVPLSEYMAQSMRSSGVTVDEALFFSVTPAMLASFFWGSLNDPHGWLNSLYLSWTLPILYLFGLLCSEAKSVKLFLLWIGCGALGAVLSLGEMLPGLRFMLEHLPILRVARYPEKLLLLSHGVICLGAAVALHCLFKHSTKAKLVAIPIFLLTCFDLFTTSFSALPVNSWREVVSPPRILQGITDPFARVYSIIHEDKDNALPPLADKPWLKFATSSFYGIHNLNNPSSINLQSALEIELLLTQLPTPQKIALLELFSVGFVTIPPAIGQLAGGVGDRVGQEEGFNLYKLPKPRPRAYFASSLTLASGDKIDELRQLLAADAIPLAVVVDAGLKGDFKPASAEDKVNIKQYAGDHVIVETTNADTRLLVLNDTFYPGWRASVNGAPTTIHRVNKTVRGVVVPAGSNTVVFEYAPRSVQIGTAISLCSLFALLIVALWGSRMSSRMEQYRLGLGCVLRHREGE